MEYRKLGRSGLKVSPLCLGAMMFGGPADEAQSQRMITAARDAGINFIDTADVYNGGKSEEVVGRAIRNERDRWVVATKLNGIMGPGANQRGSSRKWIFEAVRGSLARLGTDYIDVYYLHREDLETPLEESVHALGDLVRAGMIRYFALSNHKAWRIAEICNICDRTGIDRPVATQPLYNALNRMAEVEQFPAAAYYGLGAVPYSPLARGVLSGKYAAGAAPPADSRAGRSDARMMQTEWRPESLAIAQKLKGRAEALGMSASQFAMAWVLANGLVTSVICGPRTEAQLAEYIGALDRRLPPDCEALVDSLVVPGHPSTPGYRDPMEPVEGRVTRPPQTDRPAV
jgi:aryl-alcohol dehydrogenase-like predicted oxidoreductase